ncbi:MAG: DnaA/Hda family protein [Thermoguttaceae bacterium]|nr:DnaA/Hda family protein [Thermoguttaceae bacterium]
MVRRVKETEKRELSGLLPSESVVFGFFCGPENRLVPHIVLELQQGRKQSYIPVLLYGPAGVGKTLLATGIENAIRHEFRRRRVYRTTAQDLTHDFADASESGRVAELRQQLLQASVVIVEDLENLVGRDLVQRELLRLLDVAAERGRAVLFTADSPPGEWTQLRPMFVSRVLCGLNVRLQPPSYATRCRLIRYWTMFEGLELTDEAVAILAAQWVGTVPVIHGLVRKMLMTLKADPVWIRALLELNGRRYLSGEQVKRYLDEVSQTLERPSIHEIAKATAKYFGVRLLDLRGQSRQQTIVVARHCAVALAEALCGQSLRDIGHYFSGRDHATILHSCRKVRELVDSEPEIRDAIHTLRERFDAVQLDS